MRLTKKRVVLCIGLIIVLFLVWFVVSDEFRKYFFKPTGSSLPAGTGIEEVGVADIETIASDLSIPWSIVELPDGDLMFTERPGSIKRIGKN